MATRFFCDSCGDQILDEKDVLQLFGNDYCDVCYHEQGDDIEVDVDYDDEPSYDIDAGFDPYMAATPTTARSNK